MEWCVAALRLYGRGRPYLRDLWRHPVPHTNRGDTPSHANRGEPRTRTIREDRLTHIWIRGRLMRAQLKEFHISTMRFCKLLTSC